MKNNAGYITYVGTILMPIQKVKIRFCEKEESSLNPFQEMILEAIEQECRIEQISQATLLTPYVIRSEIAQLVSQKLLLQEGDDVILPEISKKILAVSRCVQHLNDEEQTAYVNLYVGALEEADFVPVKEEASELKLRPKIPEQEIEGITIEDDFDFFRKRMRAFHQMPDKEADAVLSSIYVDLRTAGAKAYRAQRIRRLPCLIGARQPNGEARKDAVGFSARGQLCKIRYSIRPSDTPYPALAGKDIVCYYDYVSRTAQIDKPTVFDSNPDKVDFELPRCGELNDAESRNMKKLVAQYYGVSDETALEEAERTDEDYIVNGQLDDLLGGAE